MSFLKYFLITIALLVLLFLLVGVFAPSEFVVSRTQIIDAPKSLVKEQVVNLKKFPAWSPWADRDTNAKQTFEGEMGKVGSTYEWDGNEDIGKGKMEVTSVSDDRVEKKITFIRPFESESNGYHVLKEKNGKVEVEWGFTGEFDYPSNVMLLFMDMDQEVGKDYEKGLKKLKARCEKLKEQSAEKEDEGIDIETIDLVEKTYVIKKDTLNFSGIQEFYSTHFPAISKEAAKSGLSLSGAPSGIYFSWNEKDSNAVMAAAIPVKGEGKVKGYEIMDIDGGKSLKVAYKGAYDESGAVHYAIEDYIKEQDLKTRGYAIESYVTDPSEEPDTSEWLTNIYYPLE